eukprot:1871386-Rhodomonas_salina.1
MNGRCQSQCHVGQTRAQRDSDGRAFSLAAIMMKGRGSQLASSSSTEEKQSSQRLLVLRRLWLEGCGSEPL